jgi:hypothetical protein
MYICKEIHEKINPFVPSVPRSDKQRMLSFSYSDVTPSGYDDDDDDMPDFNEAVPISVARAAVSEFSEYESFQKETVE